MKLRMLAPVLALIVGLGLTACGGGSTSTIHGTVAPSSTTASVLGITADTYSGCAGASPQPGTQVTVIDPSEKVIGNATLGTWSHAHFAISGVQDYLCIMPFTMTGVAGEPRYGLQERYSKVRG